MELNLRGKTALVTGASRGIGASIAQELAREGVRVCLAARDQSKLDEVAGSIAAISGSNRTAVIAGDLRQPATAQAAVEAAVAAFGRLDILVNNAGATKRADFFALTEDDWQDGFALKFHGYVRTTRAAWPHLRESHGCIVNIVGIGSRSGSAEFTIGGSVNVALLNFTKAMADHRRQGRRAGERDQPRAGRDRAFRLATSNACRASTASIVSRRSNSCWPRTTRRESAGRRRSAG